MKALWDGVYSLVDPVLSDELYPGTAVNASFPYTVYNIESTDPFDYSTKGKGFDHYDIIFECYAKSMDTVGTMIETIWQRFENHKPTVSGATYNASYRAEYAIELDPDYAWPHYERGLAHREIENFRAALADLSRYLELEPSAENREAIEQWIDELEKRIPGL